MIVFQLTGKRVCVKRAKIKLKNMELLLKEGSIFNFNFMALPIEFGWEIMGKC